MQVATLSRAWGLVVADPVPRDGTSPYAPVSPPPRAIWDRTAEQFRRWRDGDRPALDELVADVTPLLWQVARACGLTGPDAEDVVQSTWLSLVGSADSIRDPQAVAAWLSTTTRREAWRVARRVGRVEPVGDLDDDLVSPEPSAERVAVEADESDRMWTCIRRLDQRCQRLLRIIAFEHRPDYAGIARDLDMPVGSIGPTRGRCLGKLRRLLQQPEGSLT